MFLLLSLNQSPSETCFRGLEAGDTVWRVTREAARGSQHEVI